MSVLMSCDGARANLSRYIDDRLPASELAAIRAHLGACAACRAEREALARVDDVVAAALGDHPFGDAGVERVLAGLPLSELARRPQAAPRLAAHRGGRAGIGLAVAAAGLLFAVGLGLTMDDGPAPHPGLPAALARAEAGVMILDGLTGQPSTGNVVREGDRVLAVATPGRVVLEDGTRLELHADTSLDLVRDRDGGLSAHLDPAGAEGKVYCEVARRTRPLRVHAQGLEVEVLGTRFVVEQVRDGSSVTVIEGRVRATSAAQRRILTAGFRALAPARSRRLEVASVEAPRRFASWHPRLREEQAILDAQARPAPTPAPSAEPLPTPPAEPAPTPAPEPSDPTTPTQLDVPIQPPVIEPEAADGGR